MQILKDCILIFIKVQRCAADIHRHLANPRAASLRTTSRRQCNQMDVMNGFHNGDRGGSVWRVRRRNNSRTTGNMGFLSANFPEGQSCRYECASGISHSQVSSPAIRHSAAIAVFYISATVIKDLLATPHFTYSEK